MWSKLFQTDFERKDGGIAYLGRRYLLSRLMSNIHANITLDLGCGDGRLLRELKSKSNKVVGVDISIKNIKKARERVKAERLDNIHFVVADATALPFKKNSFDFLLSSEVLEHVSQPDKVLTEISRIVTQSRYILISVPSFPIARLPKFYFVHFLKKIFRRPCIQTRVGANNLKKHENKRGIYKTIVVFLHQHPHLLGIVNRLPLLYTLDIVLGKKCYPVYKLTWCDPNEHLREYSYFNVNGYSDIRELKRSFAEYNFAIKKSMGGHMLIDFFYQVPLIHEITAELPRRALPFKIIAAILIRLDASLTKYPPFKYMGIYTAFLLKKCKSSDNKLDV